MMYNANKQHLQHFDIARMALTRSNLRLLCKQPAYIKNHSYHYNAKQLHYDNFYIMSDLLFSSLAMLLTSDRNLANSDMYGITTSSCCKRTKTVKLYFELKMPISVTIRCKQRIDQSPARLLIDPRVNGATNNEFTINVNYSRGYFCN